MTWLGLLFFAATSTTRTVVDQVATATQAGVHQALTDEFDLLRHSVAEYGFIGTLALIGLVVVAIAVRKYYRSNQSEASIDDRVDRLAAIYEQALGNLNEAYKQALGNVGTVLGTTGQALGKSIEQVQVLTSQLNETGTAYRQLADHVTPEQPDGDPQK